MRLRHKGHLDFLGAARAIAAGEPAARFAVIGGDIHGIYDGYRRAVEAEAAFDVCLVAQTAANR